MKDAWRAFICSDDHPGRHLAPIGKSVAASAANPVDATVLRQFLESLRSPDNPRLLSAVVDLISGGYGRFCRDVLPGLLSSLANERVSFERVVGPALHGSPRWDRTMLARRAGAIPTTSFISRVSARHFELPENRLLVWLLSDLARSVSRIEHSVGSNSLHPELALIRDASNGAKAHNWLAGITAPERPDKGDLFQAERSRNWSYRLAAKLARRRLEAEAADRGAWWHSVLTLLSVNWLEPVDEDDLFELYALVLIIDILAKDLGFGTPIEYGLVTKGRKHVASFSTHEMTVRVYFDQATSSVVGLSSNYTKVIKAHYGVTGAERRPDILISVNSAAGESWHIVEVKRSSDGRYISDSIYKVFGYLFDQEGSANISSALLLVPTGVFAHNGAENSTFVYLASGDDRSGTATALASMLEQHGKLSKR